MSAGRLAILILAPVALVLATRDAILRARLALRLWRDPGLAYPWRRAWRAAGRLTEEARGLL